MLGNHDMNLKHSSRVSSLDVFGTEGFRDSCTLYKDMTQVDIEGVKCLMVPWVENHSAVVEKLAEISPEEKGTRLLFGHLAVSGAIQQPSVAVTSRHRTHSGVLKGRHLMDFRCSYLGHFHHHQVLGDGRVWYVGAPMQHHFGDKADEKRGVVLLEPAAGGGQKPPPFQFVQNPKWDFFREISLQELKTGAGGGLGGTGNAEEAIRNLPFEVVGKRINIRCNALDAVDFESWRAKLVDAGASDVRRKVEIGWGILQDAVKPSSSSTGEDALDPDAASADGTSDPTISQHDASKQQSFQAPTTTTFIEALPAFLNTIPEDSTLFPSSQRDEYLALAERLMRQADTQTLPDTSTSTSTTSSLPIFPATLRTLTIQNFFSIQGTLTIPFSKLSPGTWFVTGPNGSGKSTILEAIVWCLFGEVLRSDMAAADPVNDVIGKNCRVRIDFENGYSVERLRKFPSRGHIRVGLKLYKDGVEVPSFERGEAKKSQSALERDIIGTDFNTITKSVIFGDQGGGAGNFLTLDTKQRREVLEELLGISNFELYLKTVREEKKAAEKEHVMLTSKSETIAREMQGLESEYARLNSTLGPKESLKKNAETELAKLEQEVTKFEQDRARIEMEQGVILAWNTVYETLQRCQEEKRLVQEQLRVKSDKVAEAKVLLDKVEEAKPFHTKMANSTCELERIQKLIQAKETDLRSFKSRIYELDDTIDTFGQEMAKGVCPTCRQSLADPQHVQYQIEDSQKTKAELLLKMTGISAEIGAAQAEAFDQSKKHSLVIGELQEKDISSGFLNTLLEREKEARKVLAANEGPMKRLHTELKKVEAKIAKSLDGKSMEEVAILSNRSTDEDACSLRAIMQIHANLLKRIQVLSAKRITLTSAVTKLTTELTYTVTQLADTKAKLMRYSAEMETGRARATKLEQSLRVLLFWETAFNKKLATTAAPNMRHFLISNSIEELNSLIKSNMEVLTNPTSSITPTTSTSSIMSKINALPISFTPDLSIHPPSAFGKRSSGQRKRNNLAVLFALFQLIRQKSRFRADFIMLDEVFDALDREGQVQAAELISEITMDRASGVKHVIVVTHSQTLEDVVKVGGGAGARVIRVAMTARGTEIVDPEGTVEHVWGVVDGEEGIPDVDTLSAPVRKRVRKAKEHEVEVLVEEQTAVGSGH